MALAGPPRSYEKELPPRLFSHQCLEGEFLAVQCLARVARRRPGVRTRDRIPAMPIRARTTLFAGRMNHCLEMRGTPPRVYDAYVTRRAGELLCPPERLLKVEPKGVSF